MVFPLDQSMSQMRRGKQDPGSHPIFAGARLFKPDFDNYAKIR